MVQAFFFFEREAGSVREGEEGMVVSNLHESAVETGRGWIHEESTCRKE